MAKIDWRLMLASIIVVPAALALLAAPSPSIALTPAAERIYDTSRSKLLQIRTLVRGANRQSSLGSGFLVSAEGLAITNYHVVSQYALEPGSYQLEYDTAGGEHGKLRLLAIDLADDLALVKIDRPGLGYFRFDERARSQLVQGEEVYSMGNPLDLGFAIVEGTYNGLVDHSYNERIHFSGALNPGMSGGPAVASDGKVIGINVAKHFGGELVSFLVPAQYAIALVERSAKNAPPSETQLRSEVTRQLFSWQEWFFGRISNLGFHATPIGNYAVPESGAPWISCWAETNSGEEPAPRAQIYTTRCDSPAGLFVAEDLSTGLIRFSHSHFASGDLNVFQFANYISRYSPSLPLGGWASKWHTRQRCQVNFFEGGNGSSGPPLRVIWCARAYRNFDDLFDVLVVAVSQDRSKQALVSQLNLQGISYDRALQIARKFLDNIRWAK